MTQNITFTFPDIPFAIRLRIRLWQTFEAMMSLAAGGDTVEAADMQREFNALLARENANISRICFAYASSLDEFNDLRQDALINIWRGMRSFRKEASERTWIYRVTINSCLSTIRGQKRHRHESLSQLYDVVDTDTDNREAIENMHRAISSLGREDRAIIMMWLDDIGYEDIASAIGINRNTVATRIRRIKEKIRNIYKKEEQL